MILNIYNPIVMLMFGALNYIICSVYFSITSPSPSKLKTFQYNYWMKDKRNLSLSYDELYSILDNRITFGDHMESWVGYGYDTINNIMTTEFKIKLKDIKFFNLQSGYHYVLQFKNENDLIKFKLMV